MAEATLNDVSNAIREEGKQTRDTGANSLRVAIDSLNMTVNALGNINNSLKLFTETFLENMNRSRREALLANNAKPELLVSPEKQSGEEKEVDVPKKKGGILASLFGSLGALSLSGIVKSIGGGLLGVFKTLFNPRALLRVFLKFASKFGPIAIVAGIVAAVSGGIDGFFNSEKTTLLGKIGDGIAGAIGQVIEFFSAGFIKKEQVTEILAPITDFFEEAGVWINQMIENPGKAIDNAVAVMTRVGIWFSDVLGDLFESLGLDNLAETLFGTKVSGEMVSKFFKNLFNPNPEDGYFSIVKLLTDVWNTSKKAVETTASNVSKFFTNLFSSEPEDGYFSITKVLSDLFTSAKTTLITGKDEVVKIFTNLFSSAPQDGYFSVVKMVIDAFDSVSNLAETLYTKVQNLVAENIVDPIGNAFTSAGRFMSSLPDRIMLTIEEIWVKTMANLKIGFIKFAGFVSAIPDTIVLAAEKALASNWATRQFVDEDGFDEREKALAAKRGGNQLAIDKIKAQRDADLAALQMEKDALSKAVQAAAPTVVSGDSIATQNQGGTHYHGNVTMAPSYNSSSPPTSGEQGLPVGF